MESIGIVRAKNNNKIFVEFTRESACGESCATCSAKCAESKTELFEFPNTISANIGDLVKLKTDDKSVLSYKFLVYGLPLVLFMATVSASYFLLNNTSVENKDLISLLIGVLSLLISRFILKKADYKFQKSSKGAIFLQKM